MGHGKHVKVVGHGASTMLASPEVVEEFLLALVRDLGMQALDLPVIHEVAIDVRKLGREPFEDEGGVTGFVVLSTSHCAIHTWPARSCFVADAYSCRTFSQETFDDCLRRHFGTFRCRSTDLSAALEYPEDD